MMNISERITVGVVDFAKSTLLLVGNEAGLHALADLLEAKTANISSRIQALLAPVGIELNLDLTAQQTRLLKTGNRIDWFIAPADGMTYAELVRAVADSNKPSHTYLDVPGDIELEVVVSKGEYDATVVFMGQRA